MRKYKKKRFKPDGLNLFPVVGTPGFEPGASWTRTKRDTKLRHVPLNACLLYTVLMRLSTIFIAHILLFFRINCQRDEKGGI